MICPPLHSKVKGHPLPSATLLPLSLQAGCHASLSLACSGPTVAARASATTLFAGERTGRQDTPAF